MDDELEAFKCDINLSEYAASQGYSLDKRASSRNSAVMRDSSGDKIIIARGADNHWIYFSVRDDTDNGSIIDFVQKRKGVKLGGARQELRPWVGGGGRAIVRPGPDLFAQKVEKITKDRAQVLLELARMKALLQSRYLEEERGIPPELLRSERFAGKIKGDFRGNAVFPHADKDGPCGFEIKNTRFTGFAKGGDKGLWFSAVNKGDTTLVIAESAIDALSYAALKPDEHTRYASTGGAMNPNQPALIYAAIRRMPEGSTLIIATDNDAAGRELAGQIEAIAIEASPAGLRIIRDLAEGEGSDWNDLLRATQEPPQPTASLG